MNQSLIVLFCELCAALCFTPAGGAAQTNPQFSVDLVFDYSAAEQAVDLFEDRLVNTQGLAALRGSRIAEATTELIADDEGADGSLLGYLDSLKHHQQIREDIYQLEAARKNAAPISELLESIKKRNFGRRIVATVEQIFPPDAKVNVMIPVFVVAFGHTNVDAYVRRIVWHGSVPEFTGEESGELTIVINLARSASYGHDTDERIVSLLGVVAHEVFHAAFGAFKQNAPAWKRYYAEHNRPFDRLLDLTQNEGIAYYLSLEQEGGGRLPREWREKTREAVASFDAGATELLSPGLTGARAEELLRTANLSGYWGSYGSMSGMLMAREIDLRLGRAALIETVQEGPENFFRKYARLCENDSDLPKLSTRVLERLR